METIKSRETFYFYREFFNGPFFEEKSRKIFREGKNFVGKPCENPIKICGNLIFGINQRSF
jgi:hypothetical protein